MNPVPSHSGEALERALVGAWRLVSWRIEYPGTPGRSEPFGPAPEGLLLYTADGHMSATMQRPGRPRLSRENLAAVTEAEKAAALATCVSYGGRWHVHGSEVHHTVDLAANPNLVGTRQVRSAVLRGDELELRAEEALETAGAARLHRILWRRAAPRAG